MEDFILLDKLMTKQTVSANEISLSHKLVLTRNSLTNNCLVMKSKFN